MCQCSGSGSERKNEKAVIKSGQTKENGRNFLYPFKTRYLVSLRVHLIQPDFAW